MEGLTLLLVFGVVTAIASLRICSEWQRKVVLRLGRFAGVLTWVYSTSRRSGVKLTGESLPPRLAN